MAGRTRKWRERRISEISCRLCCQPWMAEPILSLIEHYEGKMDKKKVHVFFLLDQTGSMDSVREETISGFNEYINVLREDKDARYKITLILFNSYGTVVAADSTGVSKLSPLTEKLYSPRGMTPLYDAIIDTISRAEKSVSKDRMVIVTVMTDGLENASVRGTREAVAEAVASKELVGWKFVFLGSGFDAYAAGQSIGVKNSVTFDVGYMKATMNLLAEETVSYASRGGQGDMFTGNYSIPISGKQ